MRRPKDMPILPGFTRHSSIDHKVLQQLPMSWRLYWMKIDFSKLNLTPKDIIENTTRNIEKIENEISQEELLLDENKIKQLDTNRVLKSIALGEMDVQSLDEETKPEKKQSWDDIDRLSKTPQNILLMSSKRKLDSKRIELLEIKKKNEEM